MYIIFVCLSLPLPFLSSSSPIPSLPTLFSPLSPSLSPPPSPSPLLSPPLSIRFLPTSIFHLSLPPSLLLPPPHLSSLPLSLSAPPPPHSLIFSPSTLSLPLSPPSPFSVPYLSHRPPPTPLFHGRMESRASLHTKPVLNQQVNANHEWMISIHFVVRRYNLISLRWKDFR